MLLFVKCIITNHYVAIAESPNLYQVAKEAFFDGRLEFPHRRRHPTDSFIALEVLTELLQPHALATVFSETEASLAVDVILGHSYVPRGRDFLERVRQQYTNEVGDSLESFALLIMELLSKDVDEWRQCIAPWSALVDRGFDVVPGNYLMVQTASISTASKANASARVWDENGFEATKGLVKRLFFARHKETDSDWWRARLQEITPDTASQCLAILMSWGAPDVIATLSEDIDLIIKELHPRSWSRLLSMVGFISRAAQEHRATIPENWFQVVRSISPRMALILIGRVEDREAVRRLARDYFRDYVGEDTLILRRAAEIELIGSQESLIDWEHVLHLSRRANEMDIVSLLPMMRIQSTRVPEDIAKEVLFNCENHIGELIVICEQAYATTVAQAAPKVSQVAETEGWFASSD